MANHQEEIQRLRQEVIQLVIQQMEEVVHQVLNQLLEQLRQVIHSQVGKHLVHVEHFLVRQILEHTHIQQIAEQHVQ